MGHKVWTTEELEYLKEQYGYRRIPEIAQRLGRSETAVMIKAKRLKLGSTRNVAGLLTAGELAKMLQIDRNTVMGWIQRHELPFKQRITSIEKQYTLISPEDFWKWAFHHKHRVNFSKLERNAIPPEPSWVEGERQKPSYSPKRYQPWTTRGDTQLAQLIDNGHSYQEIADEMNRSKLSVERQYRRISKNTDYYRGRNPYAYKRRRNSTTYTLRREKK